MTTLLAKARLVIAKARVVLTAAPTVLSIATGIAVYVGTEVAPQLPDAWAARVGAATAAVLAFLQAAAVVVARLTSVLPDQRGVLNPAGKHVETVTVIDVASKEA